MVTRRTHTAPTFPSATSVAIPFLLLLSMVAIYGLMVFKVVDFNHFWEEMQ